jgi:hypothetical protein
MVGCGLQSYVGKVHFGAYDQSLSLIVPLSCFCLTSQPFIILRKSTDICQTMPFHSYCLIVSFEADPVMFARSFDAFDMSHVVLGPIKGFEGGIASTQLPPSLLLLSSPNCEQQQQQWHLLCSRA